MYYLLLKPQVHHFGMRRHTKRHTYDYITMAGQSLFEGGV